MIHFHLVLLTAFENKWDEKIIIRLPSRFAPVEERIKELEDRLIDNIQKWRENRMKKNEQIVTWMWATFKMYQHTCIWSTWGKGRKKGTEKNNMKICGWKPHKFAEIH